MTIDMSQFFQVFFDEASEHLGAMESLLLELDVEAPDLETLNAIFRAAHSIKGGAGTFGFTDMAQVTHVLETLLDRLRKQEMRPTVDMIDAFLQAGDILRAQLTAHQEGGEYEDPRVAVVCGRLEQLAEMSDGPLREDSGNATAAGSDLTWVIEFRPAELGVGGEGELEALMGAIAELGALANQGEAGAEVCTWHLTTALGKDAIADTFAFIGDPKKVGIAPHPGDAPQQRLAAGDTGSDDPGFGFFDGAPGAEAAVDQEMDGFGLFGGSPGMEQVADTAAKGRDEDAQGFGFFDPAPGYPSSEPDAEESSDDAPAAAKSVGASRGAESRGAAAAAARKTQVGESSIRVSVEKVDQLINLVGELVITHAMLAESASDLEPVTHESIFAGLSNLERNSRDLQQAVMSIRMMPISFVFNRFPRVVRDTAAALGKKVNLKLIGEDTELDKGLIERLADPLNHLVRNSIDHGIEMPERRRDAGKSEMGEITLRASHRGGSVVVEISDDGGGLNREKLLAKAAQNGIPLPDSASDKDVWQLIFHPGFSTAERVTDISGRGVGMDVVRRNIEEMNGRVDIDSEPGRGTQITIRLPLTLAILDGLSVRMGDEIFILPLTAIQESIQPNKQQFKSISGKGQVVQINDEYLPLVILHDVFRLEQARGELEDGILVIVDTSEGRAALLVDELVAQHQVVIKSLETNYRKVEGVSGATIMGDGRVALILDVDALVRLSRKGY